METSISFQIFFIGTQYAATADTVRTPVVTLPGYNSYHAWRRYADFASIQLDSGVQVMKFFDLTYHINQDFLYIAADSGSFQTGVAQSSVKAGHDRSFGLSINRETVRFTLPDAGKTKIAVFDCLGREIMTVLDRELTAGNHAVSLNSPGLKQGVYFVRMEHENTRAVARFQHTR
jgi:hypothetical protein